jgi:hypothetical protein
VFENVDFCTVHREFPAIGTLEPGVWDPEEPRTVIEQDMNCWNGLCCSKFSSKFIFADLFEISSVGISDGSKCANFCDVGCKISGNCGK